MGLKYNHVYPQVQTPMTESPQTPSFEVRLFGGFEARVNGSPLPPLRSRREQWLLALLVLRQAKEVSRDWLAGTLWPDNTEEQALFYLRKSLSNLRRALGPEARRVLSPSLRTVRLDLSGAYSDVAAFDQAVAAAAKSETPIDALGEAATHYRGQILPDCEEEWAVIERGLREQTYFTALERLAGLSDAATAVRWLRLLVAADPYRESAHRSLMQALADCGDRAAVTVVHRELETLLRNDINASPSPETEALYRELRQRQTVVSPALPTNPVDPRRHLPVPLTDLIGRSNEIAEVLDLMLDRRLVTLAGAGGIGKTRLSIALAEAALPRFDHGAWFVDLSPIALSALVPRAVSKAVGIPEEPMRPIIETLVEALEPRTVLLVLDNCEHLSEACAEFAQYMLANCPNLSILATSRQPLHVTGEQVFRVPSLALPPSERLETEDDDASKLLEFEAVQLFVDRGARVSHDFQLNRRNAPDVVDICRRLDGIPLAIELAAARLRSLSVHEVCQRLDSRFRLLTSGGKAAIPRQQTLRSLIDWSFELLEEREQAILRRLAVFAGGWSLPAAEHVCDGEPVDESEILDLLTSLVDKSLAMADPRDGSTRYRLLDTVRAYAFERLTEAGEAGVWRNRHMTCALAFAQEAHLELFGANEREWMDRLEVEHDNLRAAFACALETEPESALQFCNALYAFWITRGYYEEGTTWCRAALERAKDRVPTTSYARALHCAGALALSLSDYPAAITHLNENLEILRPLDDWINIASTLNVLGLVAREQGDYERARAFHEESLEIRRNQGEEGGISQSLFNLGRVALEQGDYASAQGLLEKSLAFRRLKNWRRGCAMPLACLGEVAFEQGDYESARSLLEESVAIRRELDDRAGIAESLTRLGWIACELGEYESARTLHTESLGILRVLRLLNDIAMSLESFANLAAAQSDAVRAARLWGAAESLRERIGRHLPIGVMARHEAKVSAVQSEQSFDEAWEDGREMTLDQAIGYALGN